jgi:hypothetical protein
MWWLRGAGVMHGGTEEMFKIKDPKFIEQFLKVVSSDNIELNMDGLTELFMKFVGDSMPHKDIPLKYETDGGFWYFALNTAIRRTVSLFLIRHNVLGDPRSLSKNDTELLKKLAEEVFVVTQLHQESAESIPVPRYGDKTLFKDFSEHVSTFLESVNGAPNRESITRDQITHICKNASMLTYEQIVWYKNLLTTWGEDRVKRVANEVKLPLQYLDADNYLEAAHRLQRTGDSDVPSHKLVKIFEMYMSLRERLELELHIDKEKEKYAPGGPGANELADMYLKMKEQSVRSQAFQQVLDGVNTPLPQGSLSKNRLSNKPKTAESEPREANKRMGMILTGPTHLSSRRLDVRPAAAAVDSSEVAKYDGTLLPGQV